MACSPVLFWSDGYANAHSCSGYGVAAMRDVFRAIKYCDSASACESGASFWPQTHDIDKRRWGAARAGTHHYVQRPLLDVLVALVFVVDRLD